MKKQPDKGKITALYERLSHDDERAGESVSIENQKRILEDYAQKNGFTNIRHFTDDGVRGTTFKRPGLDAMLEEIRAGNVATVIIKDQSRIGRDVVEVGLLKRTFDEYHVRFIAANDNLDTANGFDIMSIFRDVINEWYVADTSRKIKTVFKSRMEKGLRCSGSVSYGYLASKENKGEWVIDEEAAAVVRRIFHSVVAGESIASIARALRAEKIPIPSEHWKRIGAPVRAAKYTDPYAWSTTTISYILKRPEYTGRKVLGKTVCENYKTKSTRKTAPEEQYIFDGEIPAIVDEETWNLLCDKADDVYGGKLPIHVRCLIDECANIGQIPNLEKLVATIRSREISACLVLQARSQLKAIYKDNADTIVGNMDSQIFLGGSEPTTLKDLSEMLGKETIDAFNTSDTRGNSPSYGTTFQKMGHELLSRDELAVLDGGKCILQLRGVRPFLSDKYDLTQHPNYKLTSDYDPKNIFDIEKYLNRKEKIHPGDEFIVVDADSLPPA